MAGSATLTIGRFLDRRHDLIVAEDVDVLLVAGDVFAGISPSGEAQLLLYGAIARMVGSLPHLKIILTAGNHDPAQRLEAPEAVRRRAFPCIAGARAGPVPHGR